MAGQSVILTTLAVPAHASHLEAIYQYFTITLPKHAHALCRDFLRMQK